MQALGVLVLIGLAERIGIPLVSFIKSILKINGDYKPDQNEERIDDLEKHAVVANSEMGQIRDSLLEIKDDIKETHSYLREHAEQDNKVQTDILITLSKLK